MAQSATTVTPENPTPPTNLSFVGATPPLDPAQAAVDDGTPGAVGSFAVKTAAAGAGTSVDHEGRGAETSATMTYSSAIYTPAGALVMYGCGPALAAAPAMPVPNQNAASTLSPATNPTLTSLGTPSTVSGAGTVSQTVTGTGFTRQSQIYVNGVAQVTTFVSSTSLTAAAVTKKSSAGTWPVIVRTGGVVDTAPQTWTFT
jgi:hypothetical protein